VTIEWQNISEAANAVLQCSDADNKALLAHRAATMWHAGELALAFTIAPRDRPARPIQPELLPPNQMPKRRKAGSLASKVALLHAIAHIELNAIDLAFDIVCRFGADMPRAFTDDWVKVGQDEAKHFKLLNEHLRTMDSGYGALPAHDGLWESSEVTAFDIAPRLAIVPMVLEARGLDVTPAMIERFQARGDTETTDILSIIYEEEVSHVAAGKRWFKYIADERGEDEEAYFHKLVTDYFKGQLKPPFNKPARSKAGMPPSFYEPLADMLQAL